LVLKSQGLFRFEAKVFPLPVTLLRLLSSLHACLFIMSTVNFLPKAIEHVKKAADEDKAGNYKEAFRLYSLSLEYFMTAMKCTFTAYISILMLFYILWF
jgi:dihydrodipicolinate synthase/N-acetylneuraminate lyase